MFPFYFTNIFPFIISFLWLSFCLFYSSLSKLQNWTLSSLISALLLLHINTQGYLFLRITLTASHAFWFINIFSVPSCFLLWSILFINIFISKYIRVFKSSFLWISSLTALRAHHAFFMVLSFEIYCDLLYWPMFSIYLQVPLGLKRCWVLSFRV